MIQLLKKGAYVFSGTHVVPEEVIDRMAQKMTAPELGEGFDEIFYLNPLDKFPKV